MNAVTVIDRNPRIGTDCRMSSSGIMTVLGSSQPGRRGAVHEREDHREEQRNEHAQQRPQPRSTAGWPDRCSPVVVADFGMKLAFIDDPSRISA